MLKSSNQPASPEPRIPELELPVLPEIARRPPVLTMDQYLVWNTRDEFETVISFPNPEDRCLDLFEL